MYYMNLMNYNEAFYDLFKYKIKNNTKLLAVNDINKYFYNNTEILSEKNINLSYIEDDVEDYLYDYIIFQDYKQFEEFYKIHDTDSYLKNNGKIKIVVNMITSYNQYYYHPLSYLLNILENSQYYMPEVLQELRNVYEFHIIDIYRLCSRDIPSYPMQCFLITLVPK